MSTGKDSPKQEQQDSEGIGAIEKNFLEVTVIPVSQVF